LVDVLPSEHQGDFIFLSHGLFSPLLGIDKSLALSSLRLRRMPQGRGLKTP